MNKTNTNGLYKTLKVLFLGIIAFYTVFPLWVMAWGGFKTTGGLRGNPFGIPKEFQFGTFAKILNPMTSSYFQNLANSLIIMAGSVVFAVILCCLTGFTFARIKFWGRELFYNYFLLGLLFPLAVAILPMYLQMRKVGLIDTHLGVMLPQAAFGLAFNTMLTRSFFAQIPKELEEAATIDGCGKFGFLVRMVIPLSKPIITTISVLSLVGSWNQFLLPLLILNDQKKFTLPLGVMQYQGQYSTDWAQVLAYLTLSLIPVVIFYALAQRQIVAGLTSGSVKE
jgi:raffinose/stachyose/melibiose transport system permease protein